MNTIVVVVPTAVAVAVLGFFGVWIRRRRKNGNGDQ